MIVESMAFGMGGTIGIPLFTDWFYYPYSSTKWKKSLRYADLCISAS